jgi:hypothetical protein
MIGYGSAFWAAGSEAGKIEQAPVDVKTRTAKDRKKNVFFIGLLLYW